MPSYIKESPNGLSKAPEQKVRYGVVIIRAIFDYDPSIIKRGMCGGWPPQVQ